MANSKYEAEVVRYLRKKTNGGYTEAPTYLGSEQKFVGALRNSNDKNLTKGQRLLKEDDKKIKAANKKIEKINNIYKEINNFGVNTKSPIL